MSRQRQGFSAHQSYAKWFAVHWGVAALDLRGACVNMLGFGHGAGVRKVGETFGIGSLIRSGGGSCCQGSPPSDPMAQPWKHFWFRPWSLVSQRSATRLRSYR